jgi:hypothetical protein
MRHSIIALVIALCGSVFFGAFQSARLGQAQSVVDQVNAIQDSLVALRRANQELAGAVAALRDSVTSVSERATTAAKRVASLQADLTSERVALRRAERAMASAELVARQLSAARMADSLARVQLGDRPVQAGRQADSVAPGLDLVRRREFVVRDAPYTVHATVALPPPPDSGSITIKVESDTVPVRVRIECAGMAAGDPQAAVSLTTTLGPTLRVASVEDATPACARIPAAPSASGGGGEASGFRDLVTNRLAVTVGYGGWLRGGGVVGGVGAMVGIRLW